jgi:fructoselysine-6-P-deglycase FrlB-like protein
MNTAGRLMAAEIAEQPAVWRRLLAEGAEPIAAATAQIADAAPRFVLFVARGSSEGAALYAKYLVEIVHELPAGLVSPSTMTVSGARPQLREVLYVAVSQSGGSPDLVRSVEVARQQGALTLAVTNNANSELAAAAEIHVDILAGLPVLAIISEGPSGRAMLPVLSRLTERGADIVVIGAGPVPQHLAGRIALPTGIPEEVSPLLEILPLQQLSLQLAITRGLDPDNPRGLHKVTHTL